MLSTAQKARIKWLKGLGLRIGSDFEVEESGVFLYVLDDHIPWQNFANAELRDTIMEMVRDNGTGKLFEYDAETRAALNEDHILGMVNDHIGSAGEDPTVMEEVVAAQLEAAIEPMIEALAQEETSIVVMEPAAEREEMAFVITARGVELSKPFCKAIAARAKELFEEHALLTPRELGIGVPDAIQKECLAAWGEITRTRQRGAYAAFRYATAVVRSLKAQTRNGGGLRVNSYWG